MMEFTLTDFFIGFFLMNAMPHLVFGQSETRMLSLFGFSPAANLGYSAFNFGMAAILFQIAYGLTSLFTHGILLGAFFIYLMYVLTGRFFFKRFQASPQNG